MKIRTIRRLRFGSQIIIAVCLFVIVGMEYCRPLMVDLYYRDTYRRLAEECDMAMHEEAALRQGTVGAQKDSNLELSGMIGLAVCHQYDLIRKRMLTNGVTEERLAEIGLEALENEQIPVSRMIAPHKMERF